jgi:hypothetical protein
MVSKNICGFCARVIDTEFVASFLLSAYRQQTVDRISPISSLTDRKIRQ